MQKGILTQVTNQAGIVIFNNVTFRADAQVSYEISFACDGVISPPIPLTMTTDGIYLYLFNLYLTVFSWLFDAIRLPELLFSTRNGGCNRFLL